MWWCRGLSVSLLLQQQMHLDLKCCHTSNLWFSGQQVQTSNLWFSPQSIYGSPIYDSNLWFSGQAVVPDTHSIYDFQVRQVHTSNLWFQSMVLRSGRSIHPIYWFQSMVLRSGSSAWWPLPSASGCRHGGCYAGSAADHRSQPGIFVGSEPRYLVCLHSDRLLCGECRWSS
jgi:hypothetical protein